jgi:hypothetical protein
MTLMRSAPISRSKESNPSFPGESNRKTRRIVFRECARVLKPGGRFVLVDSLQHGDQPDYDGLLDVFPESYHEPYYRSYLDEDFGAMAKSCGLTHVRDVNAFISKVMVFDKMA